jgi:putative Mg2+ transporter-C (MgtC) family protein
MSILTTFDPIQLLNTLMSLLAAFLLGGLIGYERQYRQRTAGLRTNVLVAVGAALFVDIAVRMHGIVGGTPSAIHVVAYVVSGVGFLGAGVIMREGGDVRGINTAATLWGSAAVGAAAGAGLIAEATLGTLFVLSANTLLRPVVNHMNRRPIDETTELSYAVTVIAPRRQQKEAFEILEDALARAHYPAQDIDVKRYGEDEVEMMAQLISTSVAARDLDALTERLRLKPCITQVFWSPSSSE